METDYYEILGIDKTADDKKIKSAYRKLAKQFHPDKNKDDPDAERKFNDITQAYKTLIDPGKRASYDRDIEMSGFMSGFRFNTNVRPPANLRAVFKITPDEAWNGCIKKIKYKRYVVCPDCNGTGALDGKVHICNNCNGTGIYRQQKQTPFGFGIFTGPCNVCNGTGKTFHKHCSSCNNGLKIEETEIEINIPPKCRFGQRIVIKGKGQESPDTGIAGDLLAFIAIEGDWNGIILSEDNIYKYNLTIGPADAALGANIKVPWFDGDIEINLEPGTQSGKVISLEDKPYNITVNIVISAATTDFEKKLWTAIKNISDKPQLVS